MGWMKLNLSLPAFTCEESANLGSKARQPPYAHEQAFQSRPWLNSLKALLKWSAWLGGHPSFMLLTSAARSLSSWSCSSMCFRSSSVSPPSVARTRALVADASRSLCVTTSSASSLAFLASYASFLFSRLASSALKASLARYLRIATRALWSPSKEASGHSLQGLGRLPTNPSRKSSETPSTPAVQPTPILLMASSRPRAPPAKAMKKEGTGSPSKSLPVRGTSASTAAVGTRASGGSSNAACSASEMARPARPAPPAQSGPR